MSVKPGPTGLIWMAMGAVVQLAVMLGVLHFRTEQGPAEQLAGRARRLALVGQMRAALDSSAEAEKSAVMATSDQDSRRFAAQSQSAAATLERQHQELRGLLASGPKSETDRLEQFTLALAALQRVDKEVLDLAVLNTNLKAARLDFGPAAAALKGMDAALARVAAAHGDDASSQARRIILLASDARIRAWRIQALLPPHIAEQSPRKMDELEAAMAAEDRGVREDLESLAALREAGGKPDLEAAASFYSRFSGVKARVLELSRANTNVRSLAISLNQKRKALSACQEALSALEEAIAREPIAAVPVNPR